ncbi:MAG: adenylate/guanylate cyclase domain-containing protein [Candidatus Accumulibacter sp.]|jgi:class 3 adenylate cyclase|nr:adenylate/guanylate cyclase domain-containing protein [Accumulibacter sp.]
MATPGSFINNLRNAGITPEDPEELRLSKSLMVFSSGLFCFASILWLTIYWQFEQHFMVTLPLAFQALVAVNLLIYAKTLDFGTFSRIQLSFFLFFPFAVQWGIGDFIASSGISLMGILAPVSALLIVGTTEAFAWFFAFIFLTALSGVFDYYLVDISAIVSARVSPRTSIFFFALNFTAISTLIFFLLRHSVIEKTKAQNCLRGAHQRLMIEQDRSESLLLNILPGPIAARLKNSNQTIADRVTGVSVMFVDIVNFTRLAEGLPPREVFAILNKIFSAFDDLAEHFGMEKIKTIGDAYMVAGGLNGPDNGDGSHSAALLDLALAMRDTLENNFRLNDIRLKARIGICTGPVVAGVVGKKKFIYDLWGDTVNIASRLTSSNEPDTIQVDETTFLCLRDRFDFEGPLMLYLKGKGKMPVYRLDGRKTCVPGEKTEMRETQFLTPTENALRQHDFYK